MNGHDESSENYIKCPYCGYEHDDTDNRADGDFDGEMECSECGKYFEYDVDWTPTWYTKKIEEERDNDTEERDNDNWFHDSDMECR